MRLEAYRITSTENEIKIECTDGFSKQNSFLISPLSFLLEADKTLNICWDLDSELAPLLKILRTDSCKKLAETNKCFYRPFTIFYIPGKLFSLSTVISKKQFNLYQIKQYFPEEEEPAELSEIKAKGTQVLEAFTEMGMYPEKLTSPVAIYEQSIMRHLNLPGVKDIPKEAGYHAWQCSGKLWIEAFQVGYWEQTYDYDIAASFPSIVRNLYDIRNCEWINSKGIIAGAVYGYCKCLVTIHNWVKVSPIMYIDSQGKLSTPTGCWETYLTMGEILFILKWGIGEVEIIDGWWAVKKQPEVENYPFQVVMDRLLAYKESNNPLVRHIAKQISVGVYGKFGEEHKGEFGRFFNPVYFAEVSTQIRLEVAEFIYKHKLQDNLIHISVDGVLVDKEIEL